MEKQTPYAPEIEQAILGACLVDIEHYNYASDLINENCFYTKKNQIIWKAMGSLEVFDLLSVEQKVKDMGEIETVGEFYLIDLMKYGTSRIEEYCQILIEKKLHRDLISQTQKVLNECWDSSDVYNILDKFHQIADKVGIDSTVRKSLKPSEIFKRDKDQPKAEKLLLGVPNLDQGIYESAMRRGQVELTIADSGHGKTQYALYKAERLLRQGYKVAWFQLEGYDTETATYMVDNEVPQFNNLFICDTLYDIEDIKREARKLNREHSIDFYVFDYVQNIECNQNISRTEKVEYISKQITRMAKELNAVCNPLSQITISYNTRTGWSQEPGYGDVRWSQQLKQDASIITSVFRPSRIESLVLNKDTVRLWDEGLTAPYNSVFIKQAKVRHGTQDWKRFHLLHHDSGLKPYDYRHTDEAPMPWYGE